MPRSWSIKDHKVQWQPLYRVLVWHGYRYVRKTMRSSALKKVELPSHTVRTLSAFQPLHSVLDLLVIWSSIIGAIWVSHRLANPFIYVLTVAWIGSRQHALGTITHDAAHWRLFKSRRLNDGVAEFFCAWPLFIRMEAYRFTHLKHHEFVGTEKDPEFKNDRYPKTRQEIFRHLLWDVSGLGTFKLMKDSLKMDLEAPVTVKTQIFRALFYIAAISLIAYFGCWQLVFAYWIVPIFTWLAMILKLRAFADHAGLENIPEVSVRLSRTLVPNLFDRLFIAPRNVSYHLCHHFYMTVPSNNLKALHEELKKQPAYRDRCRITHGFAGLIKEFPYAS